MLYLAQVKNSFNQDSLALQLIAHQQANLTWSICNPEIMTLPNYNFLNEFFSKWESIKYLQYQF